MHKTTLKKHESARRKLQNVNIRKYKCFLPRVWKIKNKCITGFQWIPLSEPYMFRFWAQRGTCISNRNCIETYCTHLFKIFTYIAICIHIFSQTPHLAYFGILNAFFLQALSMLIFSKYVCRMTWTSKNSLINPHFVEKIFWLGREQTPQIYYFHVLSCHAYILSSWYSTSKRQRPTLRDVATGVGCGINTPC